MPYSLPSPPSFGDALPFAAAPQVLEFLALRRSTSAVTLAAPAPSETQLADLLRLAARVPDHGKLAPWRFVILDGDGKADLVQSLEQLAGRKGDPQLAAKLVKLRTPPMAVVVISSPRPGASIPEWEQILSAGAVCTNLLYAALAMGFGANWITDWYSYDAEALALLGLTEGEQVAGFIHIGTLAEPPLERPRPDLSVKVEYRD